MPRLIWSPLAIDDLRRIGRYLDDVDPYVAVETLQAIRGACARLETFPRLGPGLTEPFRMLNVRKTRYVIVYRVLAEHIDIVRIRHSSENWLIELGNQS